MATIPDWPASLPAPRMSGYGYQAVDPNARTNMDSGKSRVRRRFISTPTKVSLAVRVTSVQLAILDDFVENQALYGAAWCTVPVINGQGLRNVQAKFSGVPQVAGVDGAKDVFDVTLAADVMSMPVA